MLDAALIAAAHAVDYENTPYGTLITWANQLGSSDCASMLQHNLDEEKATDSKLSGMALKSQSGSFALAGGPFLGDTWTSLQY